MFTLAIVGRPNVGKSTLFNRLARKKLAIVNDTPGVTRDWREADGYLFDRHFRIIDTAGLEDRFDNSIEGRMRKQTEAGLQEADAVLFIIDGRTGLMPLDEHFARWLRKQKKPVILAINKAESTKAVQSTLADAYGLGLGEPLTISAEHGTGMEDLYHALGPYFPEESEKPDDSEIEDDPLPENIDEIEGKADFSFQQEEDDDEKPIKVAIVGRPNVGKSTLLNAILQKERAMTGPEAGITRDAIAADWSYEGRPFKLVDTAGMRKKARVQDSIEKMSVTDSLRAIRLAQVVIHVIDAEQGVEKQDIQIAEHIIEEGRALILAVNKWDRIKNRKEKLEEIAHRLEMSLAQIRDIPIATISALTGKNLNSLPKLILNTYSLWNKRVQTGPLNRWLSAAESQNPAPLVAGKQNRLKYIAQIKTRPPTFALWVSQPQKLPPAYKRYLVNRLRIDFDLPGIPIRILVRRSKNPYV